MTKKEQEARVKEVLEEASAIWDILVELYDRSAIANFIGAFFHVPKRSLD